MHPRRPRFRLLIPTLAVTAGIVLASRPVLADITDWFAALHGAAPRGTKAPPPPTLAVVSTAPGVPADPQVESFLKALAAAVKARDGALLAPRLSTRYAVDGLPPGAKPADAMAQALEQMRGPEQIVVESVAHADGLRTVKARFRYGASPDSIKTLVLDANGDLLASDLFHVSHG